MSEPHLSARPHLLDTAGGGTHHELSKHTMYTEPHNAKHQNGNVSLPAACPCIMYDGMFHFFAMLASSECLADDELSKTQTALSTMMLNIMPLIWVPSFVRWTNSGRALMSKPLSCRSGSDIQAVETRALCSERHKCGTAQDRVLLVPCYCIKFSTYSIA